ncbi:MAG TPA: SRPBCC domain-containing protein [Polyangiaceae bacterium]
MITDTTIDHDTFTITFKRAFAAPREQIFDAWTQAEHIKHWWDPTGLPLSGCVVDLRPAGTFTFTNQDSAHSPPFSGVYRVIDRPSTLVFEALGAIGTVKLDALDGATQMTVTIQCASAEHFTQFLKLGVDTNTDRTFDNLVAYMLKKAS